MADIETPQALRIDTGIQGTQPDEYSGMAFRSGNLHQSLQDEFANAMLSVLPDHVKLVQKEVGRKVNSHEADRAAEIADNASG